MVHIYAVIESLQILNNSVSVELFKCCMGQDIVKVLTKYTEWDKILTEQRRF